MPVGTLILKTGCGKHQSSATSWTLWLCWSFHWNGWTLLKPFHACEKLVANSIFSLVLSLFCNRRTSQTVLDSSQTFLFVSDFHKQIFFWGGWVCQILLFTDLHNFTRFCHAWCEPKCNKIWTGREKKFQQRKHLKSKYKQNKQKSWWRNSPACQERRNSLNRETIPWQQF